MSREMTIGAYNEVRKDLLTVWETGEIIQHPWFLAGLPTRGEYSKENMMDMSIKQVFLLVDMYSKNGVAKLHRERAVAMVKYILFKKARKKLEGVVYVTPQIKFELIEHLFRVQRGEEKSMWTKQWVKVSDYIVENYKGDENFFRKFVLKEDGWYRREETLKTKYVDPERTRWLKSGKKERFNLLDKRIGYFDNEYLQDCMLWEHLVDVYQGFKGPFNASYGEIILAYNEEKSAPYCQRTARNKLKEFFIRAFHYYGIDIKKEESSFSRDCTEMLNVYSTIDMLLKERKRGYSVADVLNGNNR